MEAPQPQRGRQKTSGSSRSGFRCCSWSCSACSGSSLRNQSGDMQRLDAKTLSLCIAALFIAVVACGRDNRVRPSPYDPAHDLGSLFSDVQLSGIFPDSKEFVDARPRFPAAEIEARYGSGRRTPGFVLRAFVEQNFVLPQPAGDGYHTVAAQSMPEHIKALWPVLTRSPDSAD